MLGIILYLYFLFVGFLYSDIMFKEKDIYFRSWMGGIFGNVILMAGIVPIALLFKFSVLSHIILIILSAAPYVLIKLKKKEKWIDIKKNGGEELMTGKVFLALVLPITVLIAGLMTNHILAPYSGGGVASGQSTYGDLQMHLGFVTSIAEQQSFPPEYTFLAGTRLNYPFFIDMLSSSLYIFGASLRMAVLIPSYIVSMLLVMGFYILAFTLTHSKRASVIAVLLFFLGGGFGFAYFFEGAKADPSQFTRIFTEYYQTPTNFNENNIRWANPICDMIVPQRTTMAGWCMILPAIWLLVDSVKTKKLSRYITLGVLAGCMPMIHTHSFLALGMISAVVFFAYLINEKTSKDKKEYLLNWVIYGAIAIGMALPQLIFWTFSQTSGNDSFLNFHFNWVNENDPYLWFYLKNWGIAALFAVPAFMNTSKDNKKLMAGGIFIFVMAELIQFQPNEYDNNKLFFITYMLVIILISEFFVMFYDKMKGIRGRAFLGTLVIASGLISGVLTIGREWNSGAEYQTFTDEDISFSEFLKENTDPNAVFLTSTNHLNPAATLAGRTIYIGSSLYVYFHGMGEEMERRAEVSSSIYSASSSEDIKKIADENGISYVVVGKAEKEEFNVNQNAFSGLDKVYGDGARTLYKVN